MDPPRGCNLKDRYHACSTDDMVNWRDEGEILRASQVAWGRPEGGFMWAPDCAYKDGKYFFYFPHPSGTDWNQTWKIGIATSDKPASGFTPVGYIQGIGGHSMIDPSVFVDTDGQAYLYYGGGGVCEGGKLKSDMVEIDGPMQKMTGLVDFHEATWVFKRNGLYYLTYADNNPHANRLRYATSSNPLGPWVHQGIYLDPTGCDTSHGSVVEYKGQWYAFYHDNSLSGQGNLRSICVDKLEFDPNGNIRKVIQTKSSMRPPTPQNPNSIKYEAESANLGGGATVAKDNAASAGKYVQNLHLKNACIQFDSVNGGNKGGLASLTIVYSANEKGKLRLMVNGVDYSFLNTPATGGWNHYVGDACLTVPLAPGSTNAIQLIGGNGGVNVDYILINPR